MIRLVFASFLAFLIGCSSGCSGNGSGSDADEDTGIDASWTIVVDSSGNGSPLHPALPGHYDLSGVLYDYPNISGLAAAMSVTGFSEWRIGAGR
jgi:hypothetical protein